MKNKKIAILTFFKSGNFGGELQAYALQKMLREKGYNVEVLHQLRPNNDGFIRTDNFKPIYSSSDNKSKRSRVNSKLSRIITNLFVTFFGSNYRRRKKRFEKFEAEHINLTRQIFRNFDQLYNAALDYDVYIVGSDQVWNFDYPFSPEPYFLTFADKDATKISYAASIGHASLPEQVVPYYKKWLDDFDHISTREEQGAEIVNKISKNKAITVLDPSLLISKQQWCNYLGIQKREEKYLLIYTLVESKYIFEKAFEIADRLNLKIKRVIPKPWTREIYKGVQNIHDAGPIEFVDLFANASFVLTNSFHGTAFSVNFNIPFFSMPREYKKTNSRFINLLKLMNLQERLVYDGSKVNILEKLNVDFTKANEIMDHQKSRSIDYILNAIDGE